jgi:hypothetical protein
MERRTFGFNEDCGPARVRLHSGQILSMPAIGYLDRAGRAGPCVFGAGGAFGGDVGGSVTQWLGACFPESVIGVHVTSGGALIRDDFGADPATPDELAFLGRVAAHDEQDQGYSAIMTTRPDTIAAALVDSPTGLLAWIVDKYRDWSDCAGQIETRWDRDTLLTVATLYWATGSIGTSFRPYHDDPANPPVEPVTVPAAITLTHEPLYAGYPRRMAERTFLDLRHFRVPDRGGHFMSHEEPAQARPICARSSVHYEPETTPRTGPQLVPDTQSGPSGSRKFGRRFHDQVRLLLGRR